MYIVLAGNTGSGKSTLAKALGSQLGVAVVSSGAVARQLSDSDPATRLALQQGAMAPEQAMRAGIHQRIEEADASTGGWILDGFPRTTEQLICLQQWTAAMPSYFYLEVDPWTCIERLVARQREHDNPDAIARRLESFERLTKPMLAVLEGGGVLSVVRNAGHYSLDEIVQIVLKEL